MTAATCSAGIVCSIARDRAAAVTTAVLQIFATAPEAQRAILEAYLRDEFAIPEETLPGDFAKFSEHEDHQQEDIELNRLIQRGRS
jgi:hypothetical protein